MTDKKSPQDKYIAALEHQIETQRRVEQLYHQREHAKTVYAEVCANYTKMVEYMVDVVNMTDKAHRALKRFHTQEPLKPWFEDCCAPNTTGATPITDLYLCYKEWTRVESVDGPLTKKQFVDCLDMYFTRTADGKSFNGVGLLTDVDISVLKWCPPLRTG